MSLRARLMTWLERHEALNEEARLARRAASGDHSAAYRLYEAKALREARDFGNTRIRRRQ